MNTRTALRQITGTKYPTEPFVNRRRYVCPHAARRIGFLTEI
uniref:Uncharacterized protein n=1 Tax=Rhizophora mucronata TaxID=61149 RepID=A0A2P2LRY1_RHIMU